MKKIYLLLIAFYFSFLVLDAQTTTTINAQGFTFSPDNVTIHVGDTINFNVGASHPVLQVSEETWNANGKTPLEGGFSFPDGVGKIALVLPGTYYYVCTNHVSLGMKGKIQVAQLTALEEKQFQHGNLNIFPNPIVGSTLKLSFIAEKQGLLTIWLTDISGKVISRIQNLQCIEGDNEIVIETGNLTPGMYLVELTGAGLQQYSKIIKE